MDHIPQLLDALETFQTLIVGIVASLIGYFTLKNLSKQVRQQSQIEKDKVGRKSYATRASMSIFLHELRNYILDNAKIINEFTNSHDNFINRTSVPIKEFSQTMTNSLDQSFEFTVNDRASTALRDVLRIILDTNQSIADKRFSSKMSLPIDNYTMQDEWIIQLFKAITLINDLQDYCLFKQPEVSERIHWSKVIQNLKSFGFLEETREDLIKNLSEEEPFFWTAYQ